MGHWVPLAERLGGTVSAVALSPDHLKDRLAFAASNAGVFRSRDGGASWEISGDGLSSFAAQSVAVSPRFSSDRTLFAGGIDGNVYRSTDGGDSWTAISRVGTGSSVVALGVAAAKDGALSVMAGTLADGVYLSSDGGEKWEARNSGLPDLSVISIALSPAFAADQTAFVASESGLQMTTTGGSSWRQVWGSDDDTIQCLAISPAFATDGTLLAGTERQGALISRERGKSWKPANAGLPDLSIYALAISPDFATDQTIAAATATGLSQSKDGGESWSLKTEEQEIILCLAVSAAGTSKGEGRLFLAGLAGGGVIRSADGGRSWERANNGLAATYLVELALSPGFGTDGTVFAWGPSDGVFRSGDGGRSWEPAWTGMQGMSVTSLALSPSFPADGTVYAGTSSGLYRSEDRGRTWSPSGLDGRPVSLMAVSPVNRGTDVFVVSGDALLWSADSGATWEELSLPSGGESPVALKATTGGSGERSLLIASWQAPSDYGRGKLRVWSRGLPDGPWKIRFSANSDFRMAALAVPDSFGVDEKFFIGNGEAVYRIVPNTQERTRDGVTPLWFARRVGERGRAVLSLASSPGFERNHTLIAACGAGVYVSDDDGTGWQRLGETLGDRPPVAVTPAPDFQDSGSVYALTMGGQLWRWEPEG
ncbi:MAG TPA: hypothetical protein VF960_07245 [Chloroflexota bacterium]